jgi:hypothetical protein
MDMPTNRLENVIDIHAFFQDYRSRSPTGCWWFRGHADESWKLIPKAGRPEFDLGSTVDVPDDLYRFDEWRRQAVAYNGQFPTDNFECLAIAQHHGLATRLLDWTESPLVAVFFACCEKFCKDGCVYCYSPPEFVQDLVGHGYTDVEKAKYADLRSIRNEDTGAGYWPRAISPRILAQSAAFTFHVPPLIEPIEPTPWNKLVRLIIPACMKWDILRHLDDYGINRAMLFPDMDGLSERVNFVTKDRVRRRMERKAEAEGP